jgi:uncharacterized repeat protein (TIGR01451 family)
LALLAPGEQSIYTCQHVLASVGPYINEASVTATPPGGQAMPPKKSAPVEVIVGQAPVVGFTVGKRQRVGGAGDFTAAPLAATVGQTVEYEIVVKNTGNAPLTIADFTDAPCDAGTIAGGPGASPLAPGASTTFTCQHVLTSPGKYINKASVAAGAMTSPSNEVEVLAQAPGKQLVQPPPQVGVLARCEASPRMGGISGPQRRPFTVRVSSRGVKRITFYIDGHRVRTLQRSQAKGGQFSIKINPRRLSYGPHRVSFKTVMVNPTCATAASARTFVRPFAARVAPRFTG